MGLLRLSSVPRMSLGDPTCTKTLCLLVSEAGHCWDMGNRLGETTSPRSMPLHRDCVPGSPLAVRSWRSRGWSPLPFLDLLCGFTVVTSPPGPSAS